MGTPGLNAAVMAPRHIPRDISPPKQLTVFVTLQVLPENAEKLKEVHRPLWRKCSEEDECLLFDVFQDPETPGRFRFIEVWRQGREWFEKVQMQKPYYQILREESRPLWIKDIQLEYFEREGEGSVYSDEYLAGGHKMEKKQVVA